jgi:hypothetical protein
MAQLEGPGAAADLDALKIAGSRSSRRGRTCCPTEGCYPIATALLCLIKRLVRLPLKRVRGYRRVV